MSSLLPWRVWVASRSSDAFDASNGAMERVFGTMLANRLLFPHSELMGWTPLNSARFAEQDGVVWGMVNMAK